jgi:hypothetical protein
MESDWAVDIAHIDRRGTKKCQGMKCREKHCAKKSMMRLFNTTNSDKVETLFRKS